MEGLGIHQGRLQLKIDEGKRSERIRHAPQQLALSTSLSPEDFDTAWILTRLAAATSPSLSHFHIDNKPNKRRRIRTVKLHEPTHLELVDFDQSMIERTYSCKICSRKFSSFQPLGGHTASCLQKLKSCNGGLNMHEEEQGTDELDIHEEEEDGYTNDDPANIQSFRGSRSIHPNMGTGANNQKAVNKAKVHK